MESFPGLYDKQLSTFTSRDDVIHDVKGACIVSPAVGAVQQLHWYRFQGF